MAAEGRRRKASATMTEIARAAGVSKTTVSFVLNESPHIIEISEPTRKRVIEAAERLGYCPSAAAKSLVTGRSNTVLIAVFGSRAWDQSLVERLSGMEACFVSQGYSILMSTIDPAKGIDAYAEILASGRADSVMLTGSATADTYPVVDSMCELASRLDVPIAGLTDSWVGSRLRVAADVDDESGGEQATSHLIGHGHRRIAILGVRGQGWAVKRLRGYTKAHEKAGMAVDPALVVELEDADQNLAFDAVKNLADTEGLTGLFAVGDILAAAAISALKESGRRVPEDCAVVGHDNYRFWADFVDPPLTTVENPFYESGFAAAEEFVKMIRKQPTRSVLLPVSLVIRRSCGCEYRREEAQAE